MCRQTSRHCIFLSFYLLESDNYLSSQEECELVTCSSSNNTVPSGEYGGELPAMDLCRALEGIPDSHFKACF